MMGAATNEGKRILELREPQVFQRVLRGRGEFAFSKEIEDDSEDMAAVCARVRSKVTEISGTWETKPLADEQDALHVVALYAKDDRVWSPQNDLETTSAPTAMPWSTTSKGLPRL